jgi:sigma-B regulation protein RsbU (phosphoserine phosphatase)
MANKQQEQKFLKTVLQDLGQFVHDLFSGNFFHSIRQDFSDLKEYYLTYDLRVRLEQMGKIRRSLYILFWLLKYSILKLSSFRRILLLVALFLLLTARSNPSSEQQNLIFGILLLLLIIILELKDKLLAREELEAGRSVQQALQPQNSPVVPGWDIWLYTRSANEVGGDLLDFINISPGLSGIAIGDVSGKGLPAALLMAKLQATLRALVGASGSLDILASRINQIYHRDTQANTFASLLYLELKPDDDEIRFVNAGHLPPILCRGDDLKELAKGDPALGIMRDAEYKEQKIKLPAGTMIFLYSDGLTDARDEAGHFFEDRRIFEILRTVKDQSAASAGKRILDVITRFERNAKLNDDLSIAIVRRTA